MIESERLALTEEEYLELKNLALKSANDFLLMYEQIPDKAKSILPERRTFYGNVPITACEMYIHTKDVNSYYFGEIDVQADNLGSIYDCRERAFYLLESKIDYLANSLFIGSYNEEWSLRKVLRRFVWHDRIHARAMYRMAVKTFGLYAVDNVFDFEL